MPKRSQKAYPDEAIGRGEANKSPTRLLRRSGRHGSGSASQLLAMTAPQSDALSAMFQAYWRGEMPLWGAFWVYGMGVGTLIGLIFTLLSMPVLQQAYMNFYTGDVLLAGLAFYAVAVMFGFWWTYYLWHVVSVWRCGANSTPLAKWGSRLFVLFVTFTYWPIFLLNVWVRFL